MKAIVVGGTGFLGLNLVEALRARGHEVVATRRPSSNTLFARRLKVPLLPACLEDVDALTAAMAGQEVVYFAAGHYPRLSIDRAAEVARGVQGVRNALEAARRAGVRRFVYTGSVVTVGRPVEDRPANEGDGLAEVPEDSTYFALKLAMEAEVRRAAGEGLDCVILLPTGCLGPYDYKVGTGFFVVGLVNRALPAWVDGRINLVDVADVAEAHVQAALRGHPGERYILGAHDLRVADLLALLARQLGVPLPERRLAAAEAVRFADAEEARCAGGRGRPALSRAIVDLIVHGQFVDSAKARDELGLRTRPLDETLARSLAWYQANGYVRTTESP